MEWNKLQGKLKYFHFFSPGNNLRQGDENCHDVEADDDENSFV